MIINNKALNVIKKPIRFTPLPEIDQHVFDCAVVGCKKRSDYFWLICLNKTEVIVPLCEKHDRLFDSNGLYTYKIKNHNADIYCMESVCSQTPTRSGYIEDFGIDDDLKIEIKVCKGCARQIENVKIKNDGEVVRVPTFICERHGNNQVRFWCPFCHKYHYHGATEGHRVAHCTKGPMQETGYYLEFKD